MITGSNILIFYTTTIAEVWQECMVRWKNSSVRITTRVEVSDSVIAASQVHSIMTCSLEAEMAAIASAMECAIEYYTHKKNWESKGKATSWPSTLKLKVVSESRVMWTTSVPTLVFLGLSVLDLCPMYVTDRQTSDESFDLCFRSMGAEA